MARAAWSPPRPLLVAAGAHTCVAWWHAPAQARAADCAPGLPRGWLAPGPLPLAVVLASSWGEEDMSGYDGLRELATALAEGGIGTLRFEWPDSGDSSAATGDASLADAQLAVDAAAQRARALSGCARLAFVGLRLGALLAAHVAQGRRDVDSLVGLLPLAGGRAFVRHQRLLGASFSEGGAGPDDADPARPVMLGGFEQSASQVAALSALRWPAEPATSLREALLVDLPDADRGAAEALARMGVRVRERAYRELEDALVVAHNASLAPAAIGDVVRWLQARALEPALQAAFAPPQAAAAQEPAWLYARTQRGAVRERVVLLNDPDDSRTPTLAGVLGEHDPAGGTDAPGRGPRQAVVLLSSGGERRVGPHRLWVEFARRRAACGDVVLRLDVAGVGDSDRHRRADPDGAPTRYDPRCVIDVARAVDYLRREHGVGRVSVMGLCSGAYHALRAALAGVDVQQVVAINPLVYRWSKDLPMDPGDLTRGLDPVAARAVRAIVDPRRMWKVLSGRASIGDFAGLVWERLRRVVRRRLRALACLAHRSAQEKLGVELARTGRRGVDLEFVFSRGDLGLALLREESGRQLARLVREERVKICEMPREGHTFGSPAARQELYARLDLLLQVAPAAPPSAPVSITVSQRPLAARS